MCLSSKFKKILIKFNFLQKKHFTIPQIADILEIPVEKVKDILKSEGLV